MFNFNTNIETISTVLIVYNNNNITTSCSITEWFEIIYNYNQKHWSVNEIML